MFRRDHHVRIANLLHALDGELLARYQCFFGGGTGIVLTHNEYRESLDVDFMVSSKQGYRELRGLVKESSGINALSREGMELTPVREIHADQYGIRTMFKIAEAEIKFEIIHEGRIELENPGANDQICGVPTFTRLDMLTTKLLANSDRWRDDSVYSRDIIDLGMLEPSKNELGRALSKASDAYGKSVKTDLNKAIERFKESPDRLDECMEALKIDRTPKALLWKKIRRIKRLSDISH